MKLSKPLQLAFQGSYSKTQVCIVQGESVLDSVEILGTRSSSELVPSLKTMLEARKLRLSDFDFFSVNFGPGAFTSLRVVVVTVNALSFASGIKILPVCGLMALRERALPLAHTFDFDFMVCMLNAYGGQAFVSIFNRTGDLVQGLDSVCLNLSDLPAMAKKSFGSQKILMVGNGAKAFTAENPELIYDPTLALLEPDAQSVAKIALKLFKGGTALHAKIIPNYIKTGFR